MDKTTPTINDVYSCIERLTDAIKTNHTTLKPVADSRGFFTKAATLFFVKGWKTLRAIHLLCSEGFAEDAAILMRSLYEMAVYFIYIAQESTELNDLAKLYLEYDTFQRKKWADQITNTSRQLGKDWSPPKEFVDQTNKEYPRIEGNYPQKDRWSGLSVAEMAKKTGLDGYAYNAIYRWACNLAHTSPLSADTYFMLTENGKKITDGPSTKEYIEPTFCYACTYYLMIAGTMNNVLRLGCDNEYSDADKTLLAWGQPILKTAR